MRGLMQQFNVERSDGEFCTFCTTFPPTLGRRTTKVKFNQIVIPCPETLKMMNQLPPSAQLPGPPFRR